MKKHRKKRKDLTKTINTPPGSRIYVGEERSGKIVVKHTKYNKEEHIVRETESIEELEDFLRDEKDRVNWLKVQGIHEVDRINELCEPLDLHPLVIEDILDTSQRSKIEDYEDYLFLIVKRMHYSEDESELKIEQISFLLFKDKIVSFQEFDSNIFHNIEKRLEEGGSIRKNKADDLLYSLLDAIVDDYFLLIETIGEKIDRIEDELLLDPDDRILEKIYILKRDLIYIRNLLWPIRNVVNKLYKDEFDLIDGKTVYYMRDISDNIVQIIDLIETYRDICSGMLDTYLSSIANKTNDVMKILTVFSTIFIPLSFLAGVYGMNFKYMPELYWKYSYASFWIISIIITIYMIRFFKKKGWM